VRTLKTFQCTHILGASRCLLCDSSAVLSKITHVVLQIYYSYSQTEKEKETNIYLLALLIHCVYSQVTQEAHAFVS